jgi:diketogulonate reductase-like aldo/keto reductase
VPSGPAIRRLDTVTVRDVEGPALGLGTWQLAGQQCYEMVSTALELGYRHVDTAQIYDNESAVGRADADVDREAVFLTTKVAPGNARYDDVKASTRASLGWSTLTTSTCFSCTGRTRSSPSRTPPARWPSYATTA